MDNELDVGVAADMLTLAELLVAASEVDSSSANSRYRRACALLDQVLVTLGDREPDLAAAALELQSIAYHATGAEEAAWESARRASDLAPDDEILLTNLLEISMSIGKTREAVRAADALAAKHPAEPDYRANLALALLLAGRLTEARREAQAAVEKAPNDTISINLLETIEAVARGDMPRPQRYRN